MKKHVFYDLQTGGYSAHTTLEGLATMLIEDDEIYGEMLEKEHSLLSDEFCRNIIESVGYQILEANEENIADYEAYHDMLFK